MRNTLQGLKLKEKSEGDGKDKIEKAVQETLDWLEGVVNPITMILCRASRSECPPPFFSLAPPRVLWARGPSMSCCIRARSRSNQLF